jgi:hypothetical protein
MALIKENRKWRKAGAEDGKCVLVGDRMWPDHQLPRKGAFYACTKDSEERGVTWEQWAVNGEIYAPTRCVTSEDRTRKWQYFATMVFMVGKRLGEF